MKVSKRIKNLASMVENKNVVDIGCDHALLDIYLTLNGFNCIASDINDNALNFARCNIKKYNVDIPIVVSDGFENIEIKNDTTVVIAGMGTSTILSILENEKSKLVDTFIIQSNNEHESLRRYMISKGYIIKDELGFIDQKKRYTIIKFKKGKKKYKKIEYILGPCLINKNDNETKKYFLSIFEENKRNLEKIPLKMIKKRHNLIKINKKLKELI